MAFILVCSEYEMEIEMEIEMGIEYVTVSLNAPSVDMRAISKNR